LQNLQGIVIPRVHGYYDIWGLLRLLALENVSTATPEDGPINTQTRTKMKSTLARIHSAGYVHGDDVCKKANVMFLVDLERLAAELMHCRLILSSKFLGKAAYPVVIHTFLLRSKTPSTSNDKPFVKDRTMRNREMEKICAANS
jgi:hypothetical protein